MTNNMRPVTTIAKIQTNSEDAEGIELRYAPGALKQRFFANCDEYQSLFDYSPNPIFSCDQLGKLVKVNVSFAKMIGYETEELKNVSFFALLKEEKAEEIERKFAEASEGHGTRFKTILVNKKGKKVIVHVRLLPFKSTDDILMINGFVKNITKMVITKKALIKHETKLDVLQKKLSRTLDSFLDILCAWDKDGKFLEVSAAGKTILGYDACELIGKSYLSFVFVDDIEKSKSAASKVFTGYNTSNFENRFYKKDGSLVHLTWSSKWEEADQRFYSVAKNATEKMKSEAALKSSEEKYRTIFYGHPLPMFIYDVKTLMLLEANESAVAHYGYTREEFLGMQIKDIFFPTEIKRFKESYTNEDISLSYKGLWLHKKKNKEPFYAEITTNFIDFEGRKAKIVLAKDRTKQIKDEQELIKSNERYLFLSRATSDATLDWDLLTNEVVWNEVSKKMFEIENVSVAENIDWWFANIHEDDREEIQIKIRHQIENKVTHWEDEYRFKVGNSYIYVLDRRYILYDKEKRPVRMIGAIQNLTERKKNENILKQLNNSLEKRAKELSESNADLERFAYVASHDLQEPLRMVTSFLQLLEKRYKDKLDQKAHEYITYAVDGAERMKKLILDLLEYSRVNSSQIEKEEVDINEIMGDVRFTLKKTLQETEGVIHHNMLPAVRANKTQVLQLFQNLISNALKYRKKEPPVINITWKEDNNCIRFSIADNGIGIDPKFYAKIFVIFQRLHNREQYSGTGIGLAICKKIIDKHGGRIWVTSAPGQGSQFSFTLPKSS